MHRTHGIRRCSISGLSASLNEVLQVPRPSPGLVLGCCIDNRMGGEKEVNRRLEETVQRGQGGKSKVNGKVKNNGCGGLRAVLQNKHPHKGLPHPALDRPHRRHPENKEQQENKTHPSFLRRFPGLLVLGKGGGIGKESPKSCSFCFYSLL